MKKTKITRTASIVGIIAIAAMIGFSLAACGDDGGGGNQYADFNAVIATLTPGDPPNEELTPFNGISLSSIWSTIKSTAGGNYRGWGKDGTDLEVIFTGTTKAKYDALKTMATDGNMVDYTSNVFGVSEFTSNGLTGKVYKDDDTVLGFVLVYSSGGSHPNLADGIAIPSGVIYISFDTDVTD